MWRYFAPAAHAALRAIADAVERRTGLEAVLSLGGTELDEAAVAELERPGVRVERWVDQAAVLRESDAFITHCGLNSVHEACLHGVPMISRPFFSDQPGMAARWTSSGSRSRSPRRRRRTTSTTRSTVSSPLRPPWTRRSRSPAIASSR